MKKILTYILLISACIVNCFNSVAVETTINAYRIKEITLGTGKKEENKLLFYNRKYSLLSFLDTHYIGIHTLEEMGATIRKEEECIYMDLPEQLKEPRVEENFPTALEVATCATTVYIGGIKTYAIVAKDFIFIPVKAISRLWDFYYEEGSYIVTYKIAYEKLPILFEENSIRNTSSYPLQIQYKELFWTGTQYSTQRKVTILEPQELEKRTIILEEKVPKAIYMGSFLEAINGIAVEEKDYVYGQWNEVFFAHYEKQIRLKALEKVFPPYVIKGKLNRPIGGTDGKSSVEIWRAEKNEYYVIKNDQGKYSRVSQGDVSEIKDMGTSYQQATVEEIEDYSNLKDFISETEYFVWTDIYRQRTYILTGRKNNWKLQKAFKCSTGINKRPTPRGFFQLAYRTPYFGVEKGFRCKNAVVIFRDYMYHSILFDESGKYVKEGLYQLGQRVSHGCIRLSEEDSKWIYKNIPLQTTVFIN